MSFNEFFMGVPDPGHGGTLWLSDRVRIMISRAGVHYGGVAVPVGSSGKNSGSVSGRAFNEFLTGVHYGCPTACAL